VSPPVNVTSDRKVSPAAAGGSGGETLKSTLHIDFSILIIKGISHKYSPHWLFYTKCARALTYDNRQRTKVFLVSNRCSFLVLYTLAFLYEMRESADF
jgi:hypothetical protein